MAKSVIFNMAAAAILDLAKYQFCWQKPVTRPSFLSLCQIWCESVQKWLSYGRLTDFKMVAAAILDFWPM